jgi:alkylhydroperoxidase family enzyme
MAYIRLVEVDEAEGCLRIQYDAAIRRAGRVWNIVKTMSPNPAVLEASMKLYQQVMQGPSPLTRVQREMMAVVVSRTNDCFY